MAPAACSSDQQRRRLSCEIAIHQAKNVEEYFTAANKPSYEYSKGVLFVRYYLSTGSNNNNNRRIQLDTRAIPTTTCNYDHHLAWNESFSLNCQGTTQDSIIDSLRASTVVFELRWRSSSTTAGHGIFGRGGRSKLVGRAEVPWKSVVEGEGMGVERWVVMSPKKNGRRRVDGVKPPSVKIGMKVRVPATMVKEKKMRIVDNECACGRHSGRSSCEGYDVLALVAAFEALGFDSNEKKERERGLGLV